MKTSKKNEYHIDIYIYLSMSLTDIDQRLLDASLSTDPVIVDTFIVMGANPNAKSLKTGMTPLMNACLTGCLEVVRTIMEHSIDPTATDNKGRTALHLAATPLIARELLCKYSYLNIDAADIKGYTPLAAAVERQNRDMVAFFIDNKANVNANVGSSTILHKAMKYNDDVIISELITAGANVNARSNGLHTPLHFAAINNNVLGIELLIRAGAEVNAVTSCLYTPLHKAAPHYKAVQVLIKHGADIHARTKSYETPLHLAVGSANSVKYMLKSKADPNATNKYNITPLHLAVEQCNSESVRYLLNYNALLRWQKQLGTALDLAIKLEQTNIVNMIKTHIVNRKRNRDTMETE